MDGTFPAKHWEQRTPEQAGMDGAKLDQLRDRLMTLADHRRNGPTAQDPRSDGCIIKDGYLVYSWGDLTHKFNWYSASKPVLSTLLFFAIQQGRLKGVDDLIVDQGWDLAPKDRTMSFAHLANMVSGYTLPEPPGAAYAYNDFAIHLYALSLDRSLGGRRLNLPIAECLADLGLEDGEVFGNRHKGYGVVTSARDFARIGWFWLNRGAWNGRQVLAREFLDKYCRPHVPPDLPVSPCQDTDDYLQIGSYGGTSNQHAYGPGLYGFNWWFNAISPRTHQLNWPDAPADTLAALGFGGNRMFIIPSRNLVIAAHGHWGPSEPGKRDGQINTSLSLLMEALG
jgi:CubicO group peptidase (beta-lactamase class C family)